MKTVYYCQKTITRVPPKYEKFSDQAPNWAKVVP